MRRTRVIAALGMGALAAMLAACGPGSGSGHGAAAKASASAAAASAKASFEANPQLQAATRTALNEVQACAQSAEGMTVTLPMPYSRQQPVLTHVPVKVLRHPIDAAVAIIACTPAGKDNGAAAKACAERVAGDNGIGHGAFGKDLTGIATQCLVPASATASPTAAVPASPSPAAS
jgi:hypothetical protein